MKDFITKYPEMISRILEVEGFNREKLEKILEITSNERINFDFAGACPDGFYLQVNLEKRIKNIFEFGEFLKERGFYERDYKILDERSLGFDCYRIIIDHDKPSEVQIRFNNPKQ